MPKYSPYDITKDKQNFIPRVLSDPDFRNNGVLYGNKSDMYWAVMNPRRHPLYVWWKQYDNAIGAYKMAALKLSAVAFTNGPMMESPTPGRPLTYYFWWVVGIIVFGLFGAAAGFYLGGLQFGWIGLGPIGSLGGLIGGALVGLWNGRWISAKIVFQGGEPFGHVSGTRAQAFYPPPSPGNDYGGLCYLGRDTEAFASYRIAPSPTPVMTEVIGGLIPVVLNFVARSTVPTLPGSTVSNPAYSLSYTNWTDSDGIASWALVPLVDNPMGKDWLKDVDLHFPGNPNPLDGVIIAVGHNRRSLAGLKSLVDLATIYFYGHPLFAPPPYMDTFASILVSIGVRDAVVMDGGSSVMLGAVSETMVGPPPPDKDVWQRYGFCSQ